MEVYLNLTGNVLRLKKRPVGKKNELWRGRRGLSDVRIVHPSGGVAAECDAPVSNAAARRSPVAAATRGADSIVRSKCPDPVLREDGTTAR
jgi:hypothetical protein